MELDMRDIERFAAAYPGELSIYRAQQGRLVPLYFSEGIPALSDMTEEEYRDIIGYDASAIVVSEDRGLVAARLTEALVSGEDADLSYRIISKEHGPVWVHARSRGIGEMDGCPVLLVVFVDTSLETELHEDLLDRVSEAVHVSDAVTHELLYTNKVAREIWGCGKDYLGRACHEFLRGCTSPCDWCAKAADDSQVHVDEEYDPVVGRYFHYDRRTVSWHGRKAIAVFTTDITESRRARQSLLESRDLLEDIVEHIPAGVCVFRVADGAAELITVNEYLRRVIHEDDGNVPDIKSVDIIERVHPDDRSTVISVSRDLVTGVEATSCDFRICEDARSDGYRWLHLDGRAMPQDDGSILTFGALTDVTARKIEEERYHRVVDDLFQANPQAICAFEVNLTRNLCDEGRVTSGSAQAALVSDTADGLFENLSKLAADAGDLSRCRAVFNRKALLEEFSKGMDRTSIEYRCCFDAGNAIWTCTYLSMICNPFTDDVEAVIYSEDIDARKQREIANHIVTENAYEFIALIDTDELTLSVQEMGRHVPERYLDAFRRGAIPRGYDDVLSFAADAWVHPDDRLAFISANSIGSVVAALDSQGDYEYVMHATSDSGVRRKRLQYAYFDDSRRYIVVWQTDITEAIQKEREDAERLEVALVAANQASKAKSVFLSRMSHEIRTPMNAIIGMDTLAIQAIGDDERVADCLSKIGISSRYLLSLINDILDMSRIESGKMLLANESFLLRDLVTGVNDLIYSQACAKGLDYECTVGADAVEAYIGDAMKLQQILVNLMGNAVKFTDHGKVTLAVQQVSRERNRARLRFTISDTGKGIGDEDQMRIFEPFEQVDSSTTTVFGGTGLGLAITRSLLDLMGGTIRLRSIEGLGSEFTVEVPLSIDENIVGAPKPVYHFERMHTLVVDDDLVTCEQAGQILADIGMEGEWVTSGAEAIERVRAMAAKRKRYDFILIDWKMPGMDGIETTSRIRRIVGPDVTIIIISAYDWQAIEVEAKAAGANLLISKPLFKSTLISAFQKATDRIEERTPARVDFDFTGRRVLVAEDNAINAEIAKGLLESKGFTVEQAPDGLKTMEMFAQSAVGYYDAILMDVRMPQMDGLQAAANIRRWNKQDAKTVPIIAMTANAFDEDVEKSRAAGMDAHLAKPIEPDLLFRTLYRIIEGDGE